MKLSELLARNCHPDPDISGLTADSRRVAPGVLFGAFKGVDADGAAFIDDAVARGAAAILAVTDVAAKRATEFEEKGVAVVGDDEPRRAFAKAAARLYGPRPEKAVGVTGTNGKTSTAWFAAGVWARLGRASGSIGTLGALAPGFERALGMTTPEPALLHQTLRDMATAGVDRVAIEASSHGLAQFRVDGVAFDAAAFTNITQDHLDYHPTFADYEAAKRRLFEACVVEGGVAVISMDGAGADRMRAAASERGLATVETGRTGRDIRLARVDARVDGLSAAAEIDDRTIEFSMPCIGAFQVENALTAAALAASVEDERPYADAVLALDGLAAPPGRMQKAAEVNGAAAYVDYAHTPDALETALSAARAHARRRLVVIIGAGGDRDRAKRPLMGAAAAGGADIVIVTDDNPRSEDPASIRRDLIAGAPGALEIGDREEAVIKAVSMLEAGDLLIVAGKGHETGQIVGEEVRPFDDRAAVVAAAEAAGGKAEAY
ncbi:MAG: UDP-N-acetylmuramoyl-L-alanyl-D-glutamate--2,6-diaminopimelate ligase [Pseudomonadota bacterium]